MRIRPFEPSDTANVIALYSQVFGYPEPRNDPNLVLETKLAWDARGGAPQSLLLVAENGGALIGTLMCGYDGHRGWLYRLAVAPEARRQGVGRALVHAAESRLRALGCAKINLQLHTHNQDGARFWEALGYGHEVRISMGKDLSQGALPGVDAGC